MMKIKVKHEFRDKDNFSIVYNVGSEYEFSDERTQRIIKMGLGELAEEVKKASKPGKKAAKGSEPAPEVKND